VYLGELEIRRRGLPTVRLGAAAPVSGGSGRERFRRRGVGDWVGSGREAGEEGGEVIGQVNLSGVA
jgi:hypothetical protein